MKSPCFDRIIMMIITHVIFICHREKEALDALTLRKWWIKIYDTRIARIIYSFIYETRKERIMKVFNTTAVCIPSKHYMVNLSEKVNEIKKLVDEGKYFTINRARQYGKTTTIDALGKSLSSEYVVVSLSFEGIGNAGFRDEEAFVKAFCRKLKREQRAGLFLPDNIKEQMQAFLDRKDEKAQLDELFDLLLEWCAESEKKIVLIIDEVDTAANNQVFMDFLAGLRDSYISRETKGLKTFWSVILAGVTDVKHLKGRIRPEDAHKVNSPWNIAADFDVDMSLSEDGIREMLDEYAKDHQLRLDTASIAKSIREYTNGYPYLVSRICQLIDTKMVPQKFETLGEAWTSYGVDEAVKRILQEDNTFFDSVMGKLINFPHLKGQLRSILMQGETLAYLPDDEEQKQLRMYGFIRNEHNTVVVSNRIFEMRLYNYFIGESNKNNDLKQLASANKSIFVEEDGWLDVRKIMDHFILAHNQIHNQDTERFLEEEGRERFLTYLSPIINGTGTYSIEEQTRDHSRMDVVIHYLGRRYIIELKIWHGERYKEKGEEQILRYLEYWNLDTGYLLSFNFNKKKNTGVTQVRIGDKLLYEGIV